LCFILSCHSQIMIHFIPEWIELISLTFLIGTLSSRIWVFPPTSQGISEDKNAMGRAWHLFGVSILLMLVMSAIGLVLRTSEMSGESFSTLWGSLPLVVLRTHFGLVWLIRVSVLLVLGFALKIWTRHRDKRGFLSILLALALVISITESASGHASDAGDFSLPEIADWLHLIAASLWGGGLLVLSISILPALKKGEWNQATAQQIAQIARRFSAMAGAAVVIAAITALYNSVQYVGSFAALVKTPYGRTALIKLLAFLVILWLGAFNRYASVPLLQRAASLSRSRQTPPNPIRLPFWRGLTAKTGDEIARYFRRAVALEAILFTGILLCAALLRSEIPSRHLTRMEAQPARIHMPSGKMNH
jgi:putative copper export protein